MFVLVHLQKKILKKVQMHNFDYNINVLTLDEPPAPPAPHPQCIILFSLKDMAKTRGMFVSDFPILVYYVEYAYFVVL